MQIGYDKETIHRVIIVLFLRPLNHVASFSFSGAIKTMCQRGCSKLRTPHSRAAIDPYTVSPSVKRW